MSPSTALEVQLPARIPRDVLFGSPERVRPQLSPNGKYLAYLAPDEKNVLQVWLRDEGHGFARPENRLHFYAIAEEFLAKPLGGRFEPLTDIAGHSGVIS